MTDKEEKTETPAPVQEAPAGKDAAAGSDVAQAPAVSTAAPPPAQPTSHVKQKASKGEKVFNATVYSALNYWVNLGLSLVVADHFVNKGGKIWLTKGAEKIGKMVARDPAALEATTRTAERTLETLSLLSGGWALLWPMKKLEDNKRPIVHWLNDKLGVDQTAPDGHKETADEIFIEKEQPKQSWIKIIFRRLLATGAVLGTGQALNVAMRDHAKTAEWEKSASYDKTRDPFGGKAVTERFIIDNVNKGLKSGYVPNGEKIAENDTFKRYLGLAALDSIFTKITAVVMQVTNGAKKGRMPKEIGDEQDPPVVYDNDEIITAPEAQQSMKEFGGGTAPAAQEAPKAFRQQFEPKEPAKKFAEEKAEHTPREAESYKKESVLQRSIRPGQVKEQSDTGLAMTP